MSLNPVAFFLRFAKIEFNMSKAPRERISVPMFLNFPSAARERISGTIDNVLVLRKNYQGILHR